MRVPSRRTRATPQVITIRARAASLFQCKDEPEQWGRRVCLGDLLFMNYLKEYLFRLLECSGGVIVAHLSGLRIECVKGDIRLEMLARSRQ